MPFTRRELLQDIGAAGLLTLLPTGPLPATMRLARHAERAKRGELAAALQIAAWLHRARVQTEHGVSWPSDPADSSFNPADTESDTLYSHSPGVVLFLLELHHATGEREFLEEAQRGADHLVARVSAHEHEGAVGLYEGAAGLAYTLETVHRASGESRYRAAAASYMAVVRARAQTSAGAAVGGDSNDIVSGAAGTALTLLWWADATGDRAARELALQAGRGLIDRAEKSADDAMYWSLGSQTRKFMPNFSHGTAGVGYCLARLYQVSGERDFLDAALAGARHLQAIADGRNGGCLIPHHVESDGRPADIYYWSWCHGPVGTWRLFHQLAAVTGDARWADWVQRSARTVLTSGIPEQRLSGFWNNVGRCCGNAGVGQGFLDLHQAYRRAEYWGMVQRAQADLMRRATLDEQGLRWVQAEVRVEPANLRAQTGFMQGASGIGTWLLHIDGLHQRRRPLIVLPDSPFVTT
jgi:lantibiotic modifying enzyme